MHLRRKDKLTVRLNEDTVFVHPQAVPSGRPTDDPILRGTVTLTLAAPRRVTTISCQLKGVVTVGAGDYRYDTSLSLLKTLAIDVGGERLAKGEHSYHFSFIIPSSTATQERSKYGTCRHTVRAWCDGLGSFGSTVFSPFIPVWIIANPAAPGELPQGLEIVVQDFGGDIGPIAMHVSSSHLTVSSLVFLNITFLAPPALKIMSVAAFIQQSFELTYLDPAIGTFSPPRQRKTLFYADQTTPIVEEGSLLARENLGRGATQPLAFESRRMSPKPLVEIAAGEEWSYSRIVRVPDDDQVRPSTLEGTSTRIRVKHKLVTEVRYRTPGSKKDMILEMSTDVVIASCCCLSDSLLLPSYAKAAPASTPIRPFHRRCLCNSTLQEMVRKDGAELSRADRPRRTAAAPAALPIPLKLGMGPSDRYLGRQRSVSNNTLRLARRRSGLPSGLASLTPAMAPGLTRRTSERVQEERDGGEEMSQNDPDAIEEIEPPRVDIAV
ncbi:hypothetical protein RQP46_010587 [Phenoliferia psychrophenolica]